MSSVSNNTRSMANCKFHLRSIALLALIPLKKDVRLARYLVMFLIF